MKKQGEKKITMPVSGTEAKLAMSFWEIMALMVLTREACCIFNPHSEKNQKPKQRTI